MTDLDDLDAQLDYIQELSVLSTELEYRIAQLKQPWLKAGLRWTYLRGTPRCCWKAEVADMATRLVDGKVHFEWACPQHGTSLDPFQVPLSDLQTLLDPPKT